MKRLSSPREKRMKALQQNRYLSGLDGKILQFLAQHTHLISYEAEESIIWEGERCEGLWIIESGRVKIYKYSPTGREMIINVFDAGESFNEVPIFDQLENPVNASA